MEPIELMQRHPDTIPNKIRANYLDNKCMDQLGKEI